MRRTAIACALGALLAAGVLVPTAGASPASDFAAIVKDFRNDGDITSCLFTQAQLEDALTQLPPDVSAYSPGLKEEIEREITRWKSGGCKGKTPGGVTLRIVKVSAKGKAAKESVTIRNAGSKAVDLGGYMLRDASDHVIKFKKTTLTKGASLRVVTGCRKGHKGVLRKGTTYYACRVTEFWDDSGDVVQLVNPKGGLLSQKKYGTPPA